MEAARCQPHQHSWVVQLTRPSTILQLVSTIMLRRPRVPSAGTPSTAPTIWLCNLHVICASRLLIVNAQERDPAAAGRAGRGGGGLQCNILTPNTNKTTLLAPVVMSLWLTNRSDILQQPGVLGVVAAAATLSAAEAAGDLWATVRRLAPKEQRTALDVAAAATVSSVAAVAAWALAHQG